MEPPAFHLHLWSPGSSMITHMAYVDDHAGAVRFPLDPDYPAADEEAELSGGAVTRYENALNVISVKVSFTPGSVWTCSVTKWPMSSPSFR